MANQLIDVLTMIFAWYHGFLMVASIILNPFIFFICIRSKKLRYKSTFKLLAASSINDILVCLEWNQAHFTNTVFNYSGSLKSLLYCRVMTFFLQYSTIQFSSWIMVTISLDRLLSMLVKKWRSDYFNGVRPFVFASFLAFVIIAINFNEVFTVGYSYFVNGTEIVVCSKNEDGSFPWNRVMAQVKEKFLL